MYHRERTNSRSFVMYRTPDDVTMQASIVYIYFVHVHYWSLYQCMFNCCICTIIRIALWWSFVITNENCIKSQSKNPPHHSRLLRVSPHQLFNPGMFSLICDTRCLKKWLKLKKFQLNTFSTLMVYSV